MNNLLKNTAKFAVGTCFTLCAVTVAASVAVGNNLGKVVAAGFEGAQDVMKEELTVQKASSASVEESVTSINEDVGEISNH